MIDYDALNELIKKTATLGENDALEIALGIDEKRIAWGIDPDAVKRLARELGETMVPMVVLIGPHMALATAISAGFDVGVLAAIEAETRRIIEAEAEAA